MNLTNLAATIADLKALRAAVDPAIQHLELAYSALRSLGANAPEIVSKLSGGSAQPPLVRIAHAGSHREGSHFDNALKVLEAAGKPLHVTEITRRIAEMSGKKIGRASVDGALSRHVRTAKTPRIVRKRPGYFALAAWPKDSHTLFSEPVANGHGGPTRKDELVEYLKRNGPSFRKDLIANTGVPVGTIAYALNDKTRFRHLDDGRWEAAQP